MNTLLRIALLLTIIGAINWGLIGFFQFDLVAAIFGGQDSFLSRVIYGLVGLSGLACLALLFKQWEAADTSRQNNQTNYSGGKVNYGTEFGEESDVADPRNWDKENK